MVYCRHYPMRSHLHLLAEPTARSSLSGRRVLRRGVGFRSFHPVSFIHKTDESAHDDSHIEFVDWLGGQSTDEHINYSGITTESYQRILCIGIGSAVNVQIHFLKFI